MIVWVGVAETIMVVVVIGIGNVIVVFVTPKHEQALTKLVMGEVQVAKIIHLL